MNPDIKPNLLVAKGSFKAMGGAERDLIRTLPALNRLFKVKVATIHKTPELTNTCKKEGIELLHPSNQWNLPTGILSTILDKGRDSASLSWLQIPRIEEHLRDSDAIHLVSGDGSLPLIDHIPEETLVHLYLLEPHRGLYEETLHRKVDGSPKQNIFFTNLLLSRARKRDMNLLNSLIKRKNSKFSGNSKFSTIRAKNVYGIDAGILWPCVDISEFPSDNNDDNENPYPFEDDYVVCIGRASWAKGTWETIAMLEGTELSLAHVGGGDTKSISKLENHAKTKDVGFWISPKISSPDLVSLMRGARAIVSMAHNESFGLSPIEAFAVGTPAIFVDEGGFKETIVDRKNGRLIPRNNIESWHEALDEVKNEDIRNKWKSAGLERISELNLSPEKHAERLKEILSINSLQ